MMNTSNGGLFQPLSVRTPRQLAFFQIHCRYFCFDKARYHRAMSKKTIKLFASAIDCETAFYDAFERADLNLMMTVWADEASIVCIHPQGPRLAGPSAIRTSFTEIFSQGPTAKLKVSELRKNQSQTLSIHSVYETFTIPDRSEAIPPVLATNVYLLTPDGWRMILHHASLSPQGTTVEEQGVLRILH
jgi:ketosteroid isomerase-like protein